MSDRAGAYATRFGLQAQMSHWRQRRVPERGLNQRIDPHIVPVKYSSGPLLDGSVPQRRMLMVSSFHKVGCWWPEAVAAITPSAKPYRLQTGISRRF